MVIDGDPIKENSSGKHFTSLLLIMTGGKMEQTRPTLHSASGEGGAHDTITEQEGKESATAQPGG